MVTLSEGATSVTLPAPPDQRFFLRHSPSRSRRRRSNLPQLPRTMTAIIYLVVISRILRQWLTTAAEAQSDAPPERAAAALQAESADSVALTHRLSSPKFTASIHADGGLLR